MAKANSKYDERYLKIGLKVAYYRKLRGLTQDQLAEEVGITPGHLSRLETPTYIQPISLKTLFAISDALGVAEKKLLDFDE